MTVSTLTVVPETTVSGTAPCAEPPRSTARRRPRLLDLCCGGGGASAGYYAAGFDVVGVDIDPQPDYPFPFIHADALTVDLTGFDVIAASPLCQRYSIATPADRRAAHPDLLTPIRARLTDAVAAGLAWAYVIENVPGAPLHNPVTVCGDALRLGVRRHRLFESNVRLTGTPCWHDRAGRSVPVYGSYGQRHRGTLSTGTDTARVAMGIDWLPWPPLTQAIPPAFTHWLGVQLLALHAATRHGQVGSVTPTAAVSSPASAGSVTLVEGETSPSPAGFRHCHCGTPLPAPASSGRWPRYCSHACRQAAYRARHPKPSAVRP